MKTSPNVGAPVEASKEESVPRSRLGKLKRSLRHLGRRIQRKNKKTKIFSNGTLHGQWRQDELPKIVKKIVDSNPGITSIEIYATEIRWRCEVNYFDLFPKKKGNGNPSKREMESAKL